MRTAFQSLRTLIAPAAILLGLTACATDTDRPGSSAGIATLDCQILGDGSLTDCRIVSETPRGSGFGQIALESTPHARMSMPLNGRAGSRVRFTVRFDDPNSPGQPDLPSPAAPGYP